MKQTQLTHNLAILEDLLQKAFPTANITPALSDDDDSSYFDSLEDAADDAAISSDPLESDLINPSAVLPECVPLALPSRGTQLGPAAVLAEQRERMRQAEKHLSSLRNTIADKSFQYSHVIRLSPQQGVCTQARG